MCDAAKVTLDPAEAQFQIGYANYIYCLTAEQTYLQAMVTLVRAQANRCTDTLPGHGRRLMASR